MFLHLLALKCPTPAYMLTQVSWWLLPHRSPNNVSATVMPWFTLWVKWALLFYPSQALSLRRQASVFLPEHDFDFLSWRAMHTLRSLPRWSIQSLPRSTLWLILSAPLSDQSCNSKTNKAKWTTAWRWQIMANWTQEIFGRFQWLVSCAPYLSVFLFKCLTKHKNWQ